MGVGGEGERRTRRRSSYQIDCARTTDVTAELCVGSPKTPLAPAVIYVRFFGVRSASASSFSTWIPSASAWKFTTTR